MSRVLRISPYQTLEILRSDSSVFEVRTTYQPGGNAPPPHFHPHHDEAFEVLDGTLHAVVDDRTIDLATGERLEVRRGQVHSFWNVADLAVTVHWTSTPAKQADSWFTGLAALVADAHASGKGLDKLAFGMHAAAHRDTFRLAPGGRPLVGAVSTAALALAGRLTGHKAPSTRES